uniref:Protein kinase domain-containing protein n=1 Tax=Hemiselmis andersenii TaxID=464988 RepID=A0A6U4T2P7_HEMAN|mmetsp:Transcript_17088/g.41142  ORF Transcript_17088/g.41142 Transcript_17088/m.41142 type:complete len:1025 (+) Transcript_17088:538-3612(+)
MNEVASLIEAAGTQTDFHYTHELKVSGATWRSGGKVTGLQKDRTGYLSVYKGCANIMRWDGGRYLLDYAFSLPHAVCSYEKLQLTISQEGFKERVFTFATESDCKRYAEAFNKTKSALASALKNPPTQVLRGVPVPAQDKPEQAMASAAHQKTKEAEEEEKQLEKALEPSLNEFLGKQEEGVESTERESDSQPEGLRGTLEEVSKALKEGARDSQVHIPHSIVQDTLDVLFAVDEDVNDDADGDEGEVAAGADRGLNISQFGAFCKRVANGQVTPTCIMDFPYEDRVPGGLNLQGKERLLERMFTFDDPVGLGDAGAAAVKGDRRVVVKAHTLLRWEDRHKVKKADRCLALTSVNVRHVTKSPGASSYQQEKGGKGVVPVSKELIKGWRVKFLQGKGKEIEWMRNKAGDIPSLDASAADRYDAVRRVLTLGESISGKAVDTFSLSQTMKNVRGGAEFELVGLSEDWSPVPYETKSILSAPVQTGPSIQVTEEARLKVPVPVQQGKPVCILFVGVNNSEMPEISTRQECELITSVLMAELGQSTWLQRATIFDTDSSKLALGGDLIDLIQKYKPDILQLAVHGKPGSLCISCDGFVQSNLLGKRIEAVNRAGKLRLVVSNACLSSDVAELLSQHVEFVIGHRDVLPDKSALGFSTRFYRQLAAGGNLEDCVYAASSTSASYCLWSNKSDPARMVFFPTGNAAAELPSPSKEDAMNQQLEETFLQNAGNISDQLELAPFSIEEWVNERRGDENDDDEDRAEIGDGSYGRTVRMKGRKGTLLEGNVFAVKVIKLQKLKKANMVEACQREIDILKGLKHRHIVRYWGDFSTNKETSIVMEFAAGGSLAERIQMSEGGLKGDEIEQMALQMASALSYMHDQGVYHRDMKPENVLLSSKGIIKIADFGVSKSVGTAAFSAMGTAVGTSYYHSPQKAKHGQQYSGAKDDMWGMGCILTEMATGTRLTMPLWDDGEVIRAERERRVHCADSCCVTVGRVTGGCLQLHEGSRMSAAHAMVELKGRFEHKAPTT